MRGQGVEAYNLGTGTGYSVLQVIQAFEAACSQKVKYQLAPRRPGDIAQYYADPSKTRLELGW